VEDIARAGRRDRRTALLLGVGLSVLFFVTSYAADRSGLLPGFFERIEVGLLDLKFHARGPLEPSPQVALLAIEQPSLDRYGQFPFSRETYADVLLALERAGARQVVMDLVFSEPATPAEDQALAEALQAVNMPVLLGYFFYTGSNEMVPAVPPDRQQSFRRLTRSLPTGRPTTDHHLVDARSIQPVLPRLQQAADGAGFVNLRVGAGGIVRHAQLAIEWQGEAYPAIEVQAAAVALAGAGSGLPAMLVGTPGAPELDILGHTVGLDPSGGALLNYPGPPGTFPQVTMMELLDETRAEANAKVLGGKTVVLGPSAVGIGDTRDTPFQPSTPAVEIHAAVLDNLLEGRFLRRPPWLMLVEWLAMLTGGLLLSLVLLWAPSRFAIPAIALGLASVLAIDLAVCFPRGLWAQPVAPCLELVCIAVVITALRLRQEANSRAAQEQAREHLLWLFGRYVAPGVIDRMLGDPEQVRLGGERREISMLFSDIRGFTSVAEQMDPEQLISLLNAYLGSMTDAIHRERGMLDKYMGDGIMALFGVPVSDPHHAASACHAALAKLDALGALNRAALAEGTLDEPLKIGIGINTGTVAVGNMGSEQRFEFTAMGDEVNVASRLEGLTKLYGVECIVSGSTRDAAGDGFGFRELDRVRVKGRRGAVTIHELLGNRSDLRADHYDHYERALASYRQRRWDEAGAACRMVLDAAPQDGPARLLEKRIEEMRKAPLSDDWDGSYTATEK